MKKQFYSVVLKPSDDELTVKQKTLRNAYDIVSTICTSIIGVIVVLVMLFRVATVEGHSMNPTLNDKDNIIITPISQSYRYGDIVVIHRDSDVPLIKRVIAVAGETIDIDFKTGTVYINGEELVEDYILEPTYREFDDGPTFPLTVPEGFVFVMGDNRNNSLDSRCGSVGLVNEQHIVGKMVFEFNKSED